MEIIVLVAVLIGIAAFVAPGMFAQPVVAQELEVEVEVPEIVEEEKGAEAPVSQKLLEIPIKVSSGPICPPMA